MNLQLAVPWTGHRHNDGSLHSQELLAPKGAISTLFSRTRIVGINLLGKSLKIRPQEFTLLRQLTVLPELWHHCWQYLKAKVLAAASAARKQHLVQQETLGRASREREICMVTVFKNSHMHKGTKKYTCIPRRCILRHGK